MLGGSVKKDVGGTTTSTGREGTGNLGGCVRKMYFALFDTP